MTHEFAEIPAGRRLAAGEVHLESAEIGHLVEDAPPGIGVELVSRAIELKRIGAVGALQRAAMRQLREEGKRCVNVPGHRR